MIFTWREHEIFMKVGWDLDKEIVRSSRRKHNIYKTRLKDKHDESMWSLLIEHEIYIKGHVRISLYQQNAIIISTWREHEIKTKRAWYLLEESKKST